MMGRSVVRPRRELPVRSPAEIALMRRAGRVVAEMHEAARAAAVAGATTMDLEKRCREVLERRGARSNFLGYHGYPAVSCISVDEVVIAGDLTSSLPLIHRLHAAGVRVVAVGAGFTPHDVRAACDEFLDAVEVSGERVVPAGRHRA